MVEIIKKSKLDKNELNDSFNIIKCNMENLGFVVTEDNKISWIENIVKLLENPNICFYLIKYNGQTEGFVEIVNKIDNFFVSEVQLSDKVKKTRTILDIIKHLFTSEELLKANKAYFSILKHNAMSNKTFSHLGGKIVSENEKKYEYEITRDTVEQYLKRFINIK